MVLSSDKIAKDRVTDGMMRKIYKGAHNEEPMLEEKHEEKREEGHIETASQLSENFIRKEKTSSSKKEDKARNNVGSSLAREVRIREKNKIPSRKVIKFIEPDQYTQKDGKINGVTNFAFFSDEKKNSWRTLSGREEATNFTDAGKDILHADKTRISDLRNLEYNIICDVNLDDARYTNKVTMEVERNIPMCLCLSCSGEAKGGKMMWRLFNSLFEAKEHFRSPLHSNKSEGLLVMNWKKGQDARILEVKNGSNSSWFVMGKQSIEGMGSPEPKQPTEKKVKTVKEKAVKNQELIKK